MADRFSIGRVYRTRLAVDATLIADFAEFSGDRNPIHLDQGEAKAHGFLRPVAHGAILLSALSRMIGTEIPGAGAVWLDQSVTWHEPVLSGDEVELEVTVDSYSEGAGVLGLKVAATGKKGQSVMTGKGRVKIAERLTGQETRPETNRVALVTGGSGGVGAAIAKCLAADNHAVVVNYHRSAGKAEEVVAEIRENGGVAKAICADVSETGEVSQLVAETIGSFDGLDVIVHGATPAIVRCSVDELDYAALEPYLRVYMGGALALTKAVAPGMAERGFGRFIFIGTSAMFGAATPNWGAYLTAKHALAGLVKSMASELGPGGVTTNMISPGMMVTELTADIPARAKEVAKRTNPMRRLATEEDTAELAAFLASDKAGYINGANLPVHGGAV